MLDEETHDNSCILIIDDEPFNIALLQKILLFHGYQNIHGVSDSRLALSVFKEVRPDIVLLDLRMPYKDGFEVLTEIMAFSQETFVPVLVLSAVQDPESRIKALQMGAHDFVNKPFDQQEVITRIRNILHLKFLYTDLEAQKAHLEEKVTERTQDLHDSQLEIINRLSFAAEFRDEGTASHIIRVGKMVKVLADCLNLPAYDAELLMKTAPMHDVGKIGVPDYILLKPGPLTPQEWETCKAHAMIGYYILSDGKTDLIRTAAEIAYTHHEMFNGRGYPRGLRGHNIPLSGRITAVCDVFDALTSTRPYKDPWEIEDAAEYIDKEKGEHFDPGIAQLFLDNLSRFIEIKNVYAD